MAVVKVTRDTATVLEVEVAPDPDGRWSWAFWGANGAWIMAIAWWYELQRLSLRSLPVAFLLLGVSAAVALKVWHGWVWASHGLEKVRLDANGLSYVRAGTLRFDLKSVYMKPADVKEISVLSFGLGDNWEPSRLLVKSKTGRFHLGRNLSRAQGRELAHLLRSGLSRFSRPGGS